MTGIYAAAIKELNTTMSWEDKPSTGMLADEQLPKVSWLEVGKHIGDYVLLHSVGQGGFGTIWKATHRWNSREVAVKVLHPKFVSSSKPLSRFLREVSIISTLQHPYIVQLYDFGELPNGCPYYIMEYVHGQNLNQVIRTRGALPIEQCAVIMTQLGSALTTAHQSGVIHRDIKASNVMLSEEAGYLRTVLLDFGIAKLLDDCGPRLTAPQAAVGSPQCMAPEQICQKEIDGRADVYALGALLFQMLTGSSVFTGTPVELLEQHLLAERPKPSEYGDVPPHFDGIIAKAMHRQVSERYATVDELVSAFHGAVREATAPAPQVTTRHAGPLLTLELAAYTDSEDMAAYDDVDDILDLANRYLMAHNGERLYEVGSTILFALPKPDKNMSAEAFSVAMTELIENLVAELMYRDEAWPETRIMACIRSSDESSKLRPSLRPNSDPERHWSDVKPELGRWLRTLLAGARSKKGPTDLSFVL